MTIDRGVQSGVQEPLQGVVRSAEEWSALWRRHAGASAVPPPVDFSAEMVIAVFAGQRPTGGYSLEITQVRVVDRGLRVTYSERTPPVGAFVPQVLTAPFHVIRLPRSEAPIILVPQ